MTFSFLLNPWGVERRLGAVTILITLLYIVHILHTHFKLTATVHMSMERATTVLCSVHVWILLCYVLCTSGYSCVMFCARLDTLVLCSVHVWILLCYVLCTSGYFCVMFCARLDTFVLCSVHVWILLCYVLCTSGYF